MISTVVDDGGGEEVVGLYPKDADRLSIMLRAFESGALWPKRARAVLMPGISGGVKFKNMNSGTVPAWGVMRITDYQKESGPADGYVKTEQPDSTYRWLY